MNPFTPGLTGTNNNITESALNASPNNPIGQEPVFGSNGNLDSSGGGILGGQDPGPATADSGLGGSGLGSSGYTGSITNADVGASLAGAAAGALQGLGSIPCWPCPCDYGCAPAGTWQSWDRDPVRDNYQSGPAITQSPHNRPLGGSYNNRIGLVSDGKALYFAAQGSVAWKVVRVPVDGSAPTDPFVDLIATTTDAIMSVSLSTDSIYLETSTLSQLQSGAATNTVIRADLSSGTVLWATNWATAPLQNSGPANLPSTQGLIMDAFEYPRADGSVVVVIAALAEDGTNWYVAELDKATGAVLNPANTPAWIQVPWNTTLPVNSANDVPIAIGEPLTGNEAWSGFPPPALQQWTGASWRDPTIGGSLISWHRIGSMLIPRVIGANQLLAINLDTLQPAWNLYNSGDGRLTQTTWSLLASTCSSVMGWKETYTWQDFPGVCLPAAWSSTIYTACFAPALASGTSQVWCLTTPSIDESGDLFQEIATFNGHSGDYYGNCGSLVPLTQDTADTLRAQFETAWNQNAPMSATGIAQVSHKVDFVEVDSNQGTSVQDIADPWPYTIQGGAVPTPSVGLPGTLSNTMRLAKVQTTITYGVFDGGTFLGVTDTGSFPATGSLADAMTSFLSLGEGEMVGSCYTHCDIYYDGNIFGTYLFGGLCIPWVFLGINGGVNNVGTPTLISDTVGGIDYTVPMGYNPPYSPYTPAFTYNYYIYNTRPEQYGVWAPNVIWDGTPGGVSGSLFPLIADESPNGWICLDLYNLLGPGIPGNTPLNTSSYYIGPSGVFPSDARTNPTATYTMVYTLYAVITTGRIGYNDTVPVLPTHSVRDAATDEAGTIIFAPLSFDVIPSNPYAPMMAAYSTSQEKWTQTWLISLETPNFPINGTFGNHLGNYRSNLVVQGGEVYLAIDM